VCGQLTSGCEEAAETDSIQHEFPNFHCKMYKGQENRNRLAQEDRLFLDMLKSTESRKGI